MQSRTTTVIHSYLKTSVVISYFSFFVSSLLSFFLSPMPYSIPSEHDCTLLQCFYISCIQSNEQLALSRLMHSIHCGSAIFPYQALETRPAQETLIGCAGLRNIQNSKALNMLAV
jgi:hypothetical protein